LNDANTTDTAVFSVEDCTEIVIFEIDPEYCGIAGIRKVFSVINQ
jgi:hypothetical protein